MPRQITEEEEKQCLSVVRSFGEEEEVSIDTLLTLMRVLGSNPATQDVRKALKDQGKEEYEHMSFVEAMEFIRNWEFEDRSTTIDFISKLDKEGTGFIQTSLLRKVLTSCGSEPLTPAETDELLKMLNEMGAVNNELVSITELGEVLHKT